MSESILRRSLILSGLFALSAASAPDAIAGRAEVGGYFRVSARPDLQGGNGRLGYWNLYGRLMNEGSYAAVEMKFDVLERQPLAKDPWTSLHLRIEGGSVSNADAGNGYLNNYRVSQLYARAGNVLLPDVTWQVGTLDMFMGELGMYDMRPAQIFFDTVGLSARYEKGPVDLLLGVGDSGYWQRGASYHAMPTAGGYLRMRLGSHVELGGGGQYRFQPMTEGHRFAPHNTPGVAYEDYLRQEVTERWFEENPNELRDFPNPVPTSAQSGQLIGYLGFGGLGPLRWNNTFVRYEKMHPELSTTETYEGTSYTIYTNDLTDERTMLLLGNEMQLRLIPQRLDVVWAALYGQHQDGDNDIAPSDHDRWYASTVLRTQIYLNDTVHLLVESSVAREVSLNGNAYREHADSIFASEGGLPDTRGLEYGDTDTRDTWQGKTGIVFNPLGPGVYVRPSLRLLYGVQHSNQNNAFGSAFVDTQDQFADFKSVERHWHHLGSLEMEAWF